MDILSQVQNLLLIASVYFKGVNIGYIILAVSGVTSFLFFTSAMIIAYKKSHPKDTKPKNTKEQISHNIEELYEHFTSERLPFFRGFFAELAIKTGFLKVGPITKSFITVMNIIRDNISDINWRYKIPFYFVIGNTKSGKSHLLNNLNNPKLRGFEKADSEFWTLTYNGILFEVPSKMLENKIDSSWKFLTNLLMYFRPKRPADGIILTIPCDLLLSTEFNYKQYAIELMNRLEVLQRDLNFKLPIYVVLTKTDFINGFQDFCNQLSAQAKEQMFGWSSPYTITTQYSETWMDEAFYELDIELQKILLLIASEKQQSKSLKNCIFFNQQILCIKKTLSEILNIIFLNYSDHHSLLLRGVYFTGHQDVQKIQNELEINALSINNFESNTLLKNDKSYGACFVNELFNTKIFQEYGIAYPLDLRKFAHTSNDLIKNTIIASVAVLFSICWFWSYINLKEQIAIQNTNLISVTETFEKVAKLQKDVKNASDKVLLTQESKNLIRMLSTVQYDEIFSYAIPQTYFSFIRRDLKNVIATVFDALIAKSLYFGLDLGVKDIINDTNIVVNPDIVIDAFDISTFASFVNLQAYIDKLYELEKMEQDYDSMRTTSDRNYINQLAQNLFKEEFHIVQDLKGKQVNSNKAPEFSLKQYAANIRDNVFILFFKFYDEVFNNKIQKVFEHVVNEINRLAMVARSHKTKITTQELATIYAKVNLINEILENPHCLWMFQKKFEPTPKYNDLILRIATSQVIGKDFADKILEKGVELFRLFQEKIKSNKTVFTGFIIDSKMERTSNDFELFKNEIKFLVNQPFMIELDNIDFNNEISTDKLLFWEVKVLNDICKLIEQFELFQKDTGGARDSFRNVYHVIAKKTLISNIKSMLEMGKVYEEIPFGASEGTITDLLTQQANNLKESTKMFLKIIKFLHDDSSNPFDIKFDKFITQHANLVLSHLDNLFEHHHFYMSSNSVFNKWNGVGNPQFAGMSREAVQKYLAKERDRIITLSKEIAKPIISILSLDVIEKNNSELQLFNKWNGIVQQCDAFSNNKPGNSISLLEDFLTQDLETFEINNISTSKVLEKNIVIRDDYFLNVRAEISNNLIEFTEKISFDLAVKAYNEIAEFFNIYLANRFPFGDSGVNEAIPEAISELIKIIEEQKINIFDVFTKQKHQKNIAIQTLNFIEKIQKALPFLKNWILHNKTSDANTALFAFKLFPRPVPKLEVYARSIVDRVFFINNVELEDDANILFYNGDLVSMQFNFAQMSDEEVIRPTNDDESYTFEDDIISFNYIGNWSLFRMIQKHKKHVSDSNKVRLEFRIPIIKKSNNKDTTAKLLLEIIPLMKNKNGTWEEIQWPEFPEFAPGLTQAEQQKYRHLEDVNQSLNNENNDVYTPTNRPVRNKALARNLRNLNSQTLNMNSNNSLQQTQRRGNIGRSQDQHLNKTSRRRNSRISRKTGQIQEMRSNQQPSRDEYDQAFLQQQYDARIGRRQRPNARYGQQVVARDHQLIQNQYNRPLRQSSQNNIKTDEEFENALQGE